MQTHVLKTHDMFTIVFTLVAVITLRPIPSHFRRPLAPIPAHQQ